MQAIQNAVDALENEELRTFFKNEEQEQKDFDKQEQLKQQRALQRENMLLNRRINQC